VVWILVGVFFSRQTSAEIWIEKYTKLKSSTKKNASQNKR